jgi:hypothetical protein
MDRTPELASQQGAGLGQPRIASAPDRNDFPAHVDLRFHRRCTDRQFRIFSDSEAALSPLPQAHSPAPQQQHYLAM